MTDLEQCIESYLQELDNQLADLPAVKRKNHVEEVKGHLISFIEEHQVKGLSDSEIQRVIQDGFLSPNEVAEKLLETNKSKKFINKYTFIIAAFITLFISFLLPDYKTVPLSLLLFALAYYIYTKKVLWGFAFLRQNPGPVKNRDKIARVGAIYVFLVGLVILLGEFIKPLQTQTTFWVLIVGYVAYTGYVRKNTVN